MKLFEGVRVLDLSRMLAGPYGSMLLADLGAEVIKIEDPDGGDPMRVMGPPFLDGGESAYFLSINRNKKSLALEVTLQPRDKTLTDQEIEAVAGRIVAEVGKATGGVIRK